MFRRDLLFNITPIIDWRNLTAGNQQQVDIDNVCKNSRQFWHDYTIGDIVYVENTGI